MKFTISIALKLLITALLGSLFQTLSVCSCLSRDFMINTQKIRIRFVSGNTLVTDDGNALFRFGINQLGCLSFINKRITYLSFYLSFHQSKRSSVLRNLGNRYYFMHLYFALLRLLVCFTNHCKLQDSCNNSLCIFTSKKSQVKILM